MGDGGSQPPGSAPLTGAPGRGVKISRHESQRLGRSFFFFFFLFYYFYCIGLCFLVNNGADVDHMMSLSNILMAATVAEEH